MDPPSFESHDSAEIPSPPENTPAELEEDQELTPFQPSKPTTEPRKPVKPRETLELSSKSRAIFIGCYEIAFWAAIIGLSIFLRKLRSEPLKLQQLPLATDFLEYVTYLAGVTTGTLLIIAAATGLRILSFVHTASSALLIAMLCGDIILSVALRTDRAKWGFSAIYSGAIFSHLIFAYVSYSLALEQRMKKSKTTEAKVTKTN